MLAVTDTGVWVLLLNTENWIFREMFVFLGAMLGSTVVTVYASTLAFGRTAHIFYVAADSNPDSVFSPFGLNGEECPVDASGWFCSALFALGILDVFLELHVTDTCVDGVDFSPYFYGFFRPPLRS